MCKFIFNIHCSNLYSEGFGHKFINAFSWDLEMETWNGGYEIPWEEKKTSSTKTQNSLFIFSRFPGILVHFEYFFSWSLIKRWWVYFWFYPIQQQMAQEVLTTLKEHPEAWTRVDTILEFSQNQQTKYYALQILENVIKTRWKVLPRPQCDGEHNSVIAWECL